MKIGFSFWGYLAPFEKRTYVNTPDGTQGDRPDFVDEMVRRGHDVIRLQRQREPDLYPGTTVNDTGFPEIDFLYCEWRWPTWKNSGKNPAEPDYERQVQLLDHYHAKNIPILIHDGDLKLTREEELRWPNAILSDPCLIPRDQTRKRLSIPWVNNLKRRYTATQDSYNYVYVGNNYERDAQFMKYYGVPSTTLRGGGIQTVVHGNWLQKSPEREDPAKIIARHPHIAFSPRISYRDIFPVLNGGIAVTHLTKDEYCVHGNITCRFHEAIISEIPALIPIEYVPAHPVGLDGKMIVKSSEDVIEKVRWLFTLSSEQRKKIVDEQEEALRQIADPTPGKRVDLIEKLARG
jgi:hypothetical protein